jgi:hypothetical protein
MKNEGLIHRLCKLFDVASRRSVTGQTFNPATVEDGINPRGIVLENYAAGSRHQTRHTARLS